MTAHRVTLQTLRELILRLDALYPGDTDTVMGKLMVVLADSITHEKLDAATLATLRADADKWPESIQKLLCTEGGAR